VDWRGAIVFAMERARKDHGTARDPNGILPATPVLTNREAAALLLFGRAAAAKGGLTWDWYGYALPALSYYQPGDRFNMSAGWQERPYALPRELWGHLAELATALDAAPVAFSLVSDPGPSEASYKALANLAWSKMRRESPTAAAPSKPAPDAPTPASTRADDAAPASTPQAEAPELDARARKPDTSNGNGGVLLLLAGIVLWSAERRRGRRNR